MNGIYLVQGQKTKRVKIGSSECIETRILILQSGSPDILTLVYVLENTDYRLEREIHAEFKRYRMHGEWFQPRVLKLVKTNYPNGLDINLTAQILHEQGHRPLYRR